MNNATLLTPDRTTQVKIVAIGLIASTAVSLVAIGVPVRPVGSEPPLQTTTRIFLAIHRY